MCWSLESSFFKQNSLLRMFFLHNVFKMFLRDFWIQTWMRTFGCRTTGPWSRLGSRCGATHDLGRAIRFWSGESFSVQGNSKRSLSNRFRSSQSVSWSGIRSRSNRIGNSLGSGQLESVSVEIGNLKHKPNRIGPFILNIDLYINNKIFVNI